MWEMLAGVGDSSAVRRSRMSGVMTWRRVMQTASLEPIDPLATPTEI